MTVPDFQSLMRPLLECAKDKEQVRTSECVDEIADKLQLSQEDREEMLPSGRQPLLLNRVHWARTYLGKANVIESPKRGYFKLTNRGEDLLKNGPEKITISDLENFEEFLEWRNISASGTKEETAEKTPLTQEKSSPEERIEQAHEALNSQLKADILQNLYKVSPSTFELIIVDLLIAMGYGGGRAEMGRALGMTGDNGVDGVIKEDELGLDVVYIQAKKYKPDNFISRPDIQSFVGSLEGFNANKGVFVTTSDFARTVEDYTSRIQKRIVLINGQRLASLMIRHNVGVRVKDTYHLKTIDDEYFIE